MYVGGVKVGQVVLEEGGGVLELPDRYLVQHRRRLLHFKFPTALGHAQEWGE